MGQWARIGKNTSSNSDLRCPCGNETNWTNMEFGGGRIRATCGKCGSTVTK